MRRLTLMLAAALTLLLGSCIGGKVYDHYCHTSTEGWDKVDTLDYDVSPLPSSGRYATTLGLRINSHYPFQALTLIVDQKVIPGNKMHSDTVSCDLFDKKGKTKGQGIDYYQYHFRVSELELQKGDSLHITVRHNMRREILPGISDVGISLAK